MRARFKLTRSPLLLGIWTIAALFGPLSGQVAADPPIVSDGFETMTVIETDRMAEFSGRSGEKYLTNVQSIQDLEASVNGSTFNVDTMNTGAITIEQHALEGFGGVGMFNLLTGHNNALSAGVGISVYVTQ